jgi:hypothetical protein
LVQARYRSLSPVLVSRHLHDARSQGRKFFCGHLPNAGSRTGNHYDFTLHVFRHGKSPASRERGTAAGKLNIRARQNGVFPLRKAGLQTATESSSAIIAADDFS